MTAPDFAAILRPLLEPDHRGWQITAEGVLAAKVPALCPTCGGERDGAHGNLVPASCPGCPTIGRLLAIGAAVMSGSVDVPAVTFGGTPNWQAQDRADGAAWMLAQLRAVQP